MVRILLALGAVLLLLAGLAAAIGVLAYGTGPTRDGEMALDGLTAPVSLAWDDEGGVWIEAASEADAAAGLGYAHAADHAWAMALWRQAASGTLSEWFGPDLRALDYHARALGFHALARQTYESLPVEDRTVLDAYARGASRALAEPGVAQSTPFIVADVEPERWEPWDALAVERLHAYLATPSLRADSSWQAARRDSSVAAFARTDSLFRNFLGLGGEPYGRVYVVGVGDERSLIHQLTSGSTALSLLAPAVLRVDGRTSVLSSIPGTLVSPSGWSGGLGWGLLRGGALALEPYAGPAPPHVYSRIVESNGDESLVAIARDADGLVLRAGRAPGPISPADSLAADSISADTVRTASPLPADSLAVQRAATGWRVRWDGFRVGTDLSAFRALRAGRAPTRWVLAANDGLAARGAGAQVLGNPTVVAEGPGYAFVAQDTLSRYAAARLGSLAADSVRLDPAALLNDTVSPWAAGLLPDLLRALGNRDSLGTDLQAPYSYLRSWGADYRANGIAPSIFEWWLVSHREFTGHLPDPADSLDAALLPYTLRIARAELRDRYGPIPSDWRWGRLQGGPRYSVLGRWRRAAARPYRTPLAPPGGHPTALVPGPDLVFEDAAPGPSVWSIATRVRDGHTTVRGPSMRPPLDGVLDQDAEARSLALVLDPNAPFPAQRLALVPTS